MFPKLNLHNPTRRQYFIADARSFLLTRNPRTRNPKIRNPNREGVECHGKKLLCALLLACCREAAARPCSLRQASFCSVLISFTTVVVEGAERFLLFFKKKIACLSLPFPREFASVCEQGFPSIGTMTKVKKVQKAQVHSYQHVFVE
jgi:hypothetical protein